MRDYMKPVVIVNSEVSEGVYAASGSADECYTVNAYICLLYTSPSPRDS